ncbi:alpha/beta fold hydrolase (plasmid) [Bradyrhizobium sp. PMVTL-01]|uniref:alpha/beta fold hydrolase n=1 Tax=Bradyrhizobium sp. PMVTL-01 TaxID=3434999 RepID=UPI003F718BEA
MTMQIAGVNGIDIAYQVQGSGPPLVLVMGYRLSSAAWPIAFLDTLARQFTVITLDNRGTGRSEKPVHGYALANMARDIHDLLDVLDIGRIHLMGYSMGGAIAQEFVSQFPERVTSLILCATMCGGVDATYADANVVRVMRDLDGLSPEQAARQIWKVTYAPAYLAQNQSAAVDQTRREIALPTPLHAADLQFQAFAEFDGSKSLKDIRCPTLVLTGGLDELIPPQNSRLMVNRIPNAKLIVVPDGGHRVLWESTEECIHHIVAFLASVDQGQATALAAQHHEHVGRAASNPFASVVDMFATWPLALTSASYKSLTSARQAIMAGSVSCYGDGKPVLLVTPQLGTDLMILPLSAWLRAIGYRPVITRLSVGFHRSAHERAASNAIRDVAERVGRKAVLITHSIDMAQALEIAKSHDKWISDVIVLDAAKRTIPNGPRTHFISRGWFTLQSILELPQMLRGIGIELIVRPLAGSAPNGVE